MSSEAVEGGSGPKLETLCCGVVLALVNPDMPNHPFPVPVIRSLEFDEADPFLESSVPLSCPGFLCKWSHLRSPPEPLLFIFGVLPLFPFDELVLRV